MTAKSLGSRSGRVPAAARPDADVTLAEETLKRSEQNLNLAVGRVGTWNWDLVTGVLEWSPRAKAMFRPPEDAEVTHDSFLAMLLPEDREGADAVSIPAEILTKPGGLSDLQWMIMREHPEQGYEILKDIAFPWPVATIVRQHHERTDGSGYPHALTGDELLIESRIIAVADVVEAMASHRPYRPSHPVAAAICEIDSHRQWFDRDAVDSCMRLYASGRLRLEAVAAL